MANKVALVTGASSGIGESTALKLKELGYTVYGAARRVGHMQRLTQSGIKILAMDVTDDASMQAGIEAIIAEFGRIDVLVNNAGYGSYGAVEDVQMEEARAQFDVNVFGAVRLIQFARSSTSRRWAARSIPHLVPGITAPNSRWRQSATAFAWKFSLSASMSL